MKKLLFLLALLLPATAHAATVNISSMAVSNQTVTVVTAVNHGYTVNAGICLSAPTSACTVVATVPNATTFTFTMPSNVTVAPCASSCGTSTTAPRVIVLDMQQPNQAQQTVHYLLWLTTGLPLPRNAVSAWAAGAQSSGPTAAQLAAMAAGNFIEVNRAVTFPATTSTAQIQVVLQQDYTTQQAALVANTQPATYYGSVWDGAAWSIQ